jgi:protein gp37
MSDQTKIEWTEATWNPVVGCTKVSEGCENCYAERMSVRLANMAAGKYDMDGWCPISLAKYQEVIDYDGVKSYWNGSIFWDESVLDEPLHWRKRRRIFVCSMGDLFHESVPFEFIDKVVAVIALCPQHNGIFLTKRENNLYDYAKHRSFKWPENIIGMVTVENQKWADIRIPILLQCGFARTGVSCEPLLEEIKLDSLIIGPRRRGSYNCLSGEAACEAGTMKDPICGGLDWVIVGGESGPKARPMKIEWARSIVQQCKVAGVPVFVKQLQLPGCRKCRFDPCTHLHGHKRINILTKDMNDFPEDLRIRQYPQNAKKM